MDQLRDTPEQSNRQIAAGLGVDDKTVGAVRSELETGAEIPHQATIVGKDGVSQPSTMVWHKPGGFQPAASRARFITSVIV